MRRSYMWIAPGSFPVPSAGSSSVERAVHEIASHLEVSGRKCVVSRRFPGQAGKKEVQGVEHIRLRARPGAAYCRKAAAAACQCKPSLLQIENRPSWVRMFKKKLKHSPVWLSLHSTTFIQPAKLSAARAQQELAAADRILVNSRYLKEHLLSQFELPAEKILVNHLGVDAGQFVPRHSARGQKLREELLSRLGYRDKQVVLFVGRLREQKGVHLLLEAVPKIIEHCPDIVVAIVGSPYYNKYSLTPYVANLHRLGNRYPHAVRFVPFVHHHQLPRWYAAADVCVVPSTHDEAFGLVNVEAMAAGVPVVAAASGGISEVVLDGQTGFLLPPEQLKHNLADAIVRLLKDQPLAAALGEGGRRRVAEHFTWEASARRLQELYRSCL
ncbi:glycosyltransferase family 1 protein [Xylanibacillus composti]|uniref:Spore coat protein SA n=1 Tax=Xylanibacillus composti TaxID=1572762 RepID=A0A8J4H2S6_9BACL|nr:glycosyltransferase family 4 protein [Xylanibacillus composti]MDT9723458.1 glycosyltransferase family 1 protein [Xylanibacillus composti]GIQ68506.1 spore coat protein SA [Xylanibacillus composti]